MVLNRWERTETYISIASLTAAASVFTGALLFEARPYHRIFLSSSAIVLSTTGLVCHNTRGKDARRYSQLAINSQWEKAMILSEHGLEDLYKRLHPRAAKEMTAELMEELPALAPQENPPLPVDALLEYPSVAVIGPQGAGKSRLCQEIMYRKGKAGHRLIVIDPHAAYGDWDGLQVIGAGLNYKEVEDFITQFVKDIEDQYKERRNNPNYRPIKTTILCEEMTKWAKKVKNSGELMAVAMADTRKLEKCIVIASHGETLECLGAPKGMGKTKDNSLVKILLQAEIHPETRKAHPAFRGLFCVPGREPEPVTIEKLQPLSPGAFQQFQQTETRPQIDLEKTPEPEPVETKLERVYSNADDLPANVLTQAEWELYGLAAGSGPLSVRDAQRSAVARREGWNAEKIKEIFHRFSELGLGRAIPGKNGSLEFSP